MEQLETTGQLDILRYWLVLRRWWWLVVLCTALAAGSAYLVSARMAPVYSATMTLLVQPAPTTAASDDTSLITSERLARTYAEMIVDQPVREAVKLRLGLPYTPGGVSASIVRDTQLLRVSAEHTQPEMAALIANTVAEVFIEQNAKLQETRYAGSLANIQKQVDELPGKIETAQMALALLGTSQDPEDLAEKARLETALASYRNTYSALLNSY